MLPTLLIIKYYPTEGEIPHLFLTGMDLVQATSWLSTAQQDEQDSGIYTYASLYCWVPRLENFGQQLLR